MGTVIIGIRTSGRPRSRSSTGARRFSPRAATGRTPSATRRCSRPAAGSPTRSGRSRAAAESAGTTDTLAQRLVADGEPVLDVPAKLSARVRVFDTGQGRETDPVDAHSVAVAGLRSPDLRQVAADDATVVLRLLVELRDELGRARTETIGRIHHLLLELVPGGAKKFLTRGQASYLLRTAPPPIGIVAQTRHDPARELIEELTTIDAKIWAADKQLRQLVAAHGSTLTALKNEMYHRHRLDTRARARFAVAEYIEVLSTGSGCTQPSATAPQSKPLPSTGSAPHRTGRPA
jgi:hypothetical protein